MNQAMSIDDAPYWAWKSETGHWHVVGCTGVCEIHCSCRRDAEEFATNLNEHVGYTPSVAQRVHRATESLMEIIQKEYQK